MTDNKFNWCIYSTKLLISEYEQHELLYNNKHPHYRNRNKRLAAYQRIADVISAETNNPCTIENVKQKLNGLRSQYLAEKMKVINSLSSGSGEDEVHKPTVYWYPMLNFLDKLPNADDSQSNVYLLNTCVESTLVNEEADNTDNLNEEHRPSVITKNDNTFNTPKNKKPKRNSYDALFIQTLNTIAEISKDKTKPQMPDDAIETFGKFIVSELRSMREASNDVTVRQVKKKIQLTLLDAWDTIDSQS